MKVKFILNESFLASYIINNFKSERFVTYSIDKYKKDIVNFQNLAFELSKDLYWKIKFTDFLNINTDSTDQGIKDYIQKLTDSKEFLFLHKQTEDSLLLIKSEWESNLRRTEEYKKVWE
jgi:hypothetical protein